MTVEAIVGELTAGTGHLVQDSAMWLSVRPPDDDLAPHGWKLHISCRVARFTEVVRLVVPVLLAQRCHFKLARSVEALAALNGGRDSPAAVGKAFTVYPPAAKTRALGLRLAELLRGEQGPRVLSDRRVAPDAPVYYRYGPFSRTLHATPAGRLVSRIVGPAGEEFDAAATMAYRQPSWVADPFATDATQRTKVVGGHYELVEGIMESARGNVYRAIDRRDGGQVIVKQARAYVGEHVEGEDARLRLRNERRILAELAEVPGVPRFLDHFAHGTDEFLVLTDQGKENLAVDVARNGRYLPGAARSLDRLARDLAVILRKVHQVGVLVRDLSPKNVVVGESVSLIDFGIAGTADAYLPGGTGGYCPPGQLAGAAPDAYDDLYALGMTLAYAATSAAPTAVGIDPELPRRRVFHVLHAIYGERPPRVIAAITELLSLDRERARRALDQLAAGEPVAARLFAPEQVKVDLDAVIDGTIAEIVEGFSEDPDAWTYGDINVYRGAAGIGLELLHHLDRDDVRETLPKLAAWTRRTTLSVRPKPALYAGSTGIELFLRAAASHGIAVGRLPAELLFSPEDWAGDDLSVGVAGVGLGHLLLGAGEAHLEVARRCVRALRERPVPVSLFPPDDVPEAAGLEVDTGVAHGQAGVVEFLLRAAECGLETDVDARLAWLVGRTRRLIRLAAEPAAVPLCVSWCRGLAGIAGTLRKRAEFAELVTAAEDMCVRWIPYLTTVGQCCGLAGVGNMLIDAGRLTDAEAVLTQIALGGRFKEKPAGQLSWASGAAGLLGFLRRLRDRGGPDILISRRESTAS